MSDAFEKTLIQAKSLSAQEQIALIAALSQVLADSDSAFDNLSEVLSQEEETELLRRVSAYEKGNAQTIAGDAFREILRRKYQA